jgi:low temperature requirement protein LtrA
MLNVLRIRTTPSEHEEKTTWLELFFDLIYVAILIEMGNRLSHNLSPQGVVEFALLFIPVWVSWLEPVFYSRRFPTDDIGHRLLTMAYMVVIAIMAAEIHDVTGSTITAFLLAYAASKLVLALMYARAWRRYPEYRTMTGTYAIVFAIAALIWLFIALFASRTFALWLVATAFSLLAPFYLPLIRDWAGRGAVPRPPIKYHYLLDRFGELTIIVLGEFFIKAITGAADREVYAITFVYGLSLVGVSLGAWWLYFDHLDHSSLTKAGAQPRTWVDTHYLLLGALAAFGVAGAKVLALEPGHAMGDEKRYLLAGALAIVLLALGLLEWTAPEMKGAMARRPQIAVRLVGAGVMVALALLGGGLNSVLLTVLISLTFAALVAIDVATRLRQGGEPQGARIPNGV